MVSAGSAADAAGCAQCRESGSGDRNAGPRAGSGVTSQSPEDEQYYRWVQQRIRLLFVFYKADSYHNSFKNNF